MVSEPTPPRPKATLASLTRQLGSLSKALTEEQARSAGLLERINRAEVASYAQQGAHERRLGEEESRRRLIELELEAVRGQLADKAAELKAAAVSLKAAQTAAKRAETALERATQAQEAAVTRAEARAEESARTMQHRWVVLHGELTAMAERVEAGEATIRELTKALEAEKRGRAKTVAAADKAEEKRRAALAKREQERETKRYVHQRLAARVCELERETKGLRDQLKAARRAAEEAAKAAPVVVPIAPVAAPVEDVDPRHLRVMGRLLKGNNPEVQNAAKAMSEADTDIGRLLRRLAWCADTYECTPDALIATNALRGALGVKGKPHGG